MPIQVSTSATEGIRRRAPAALLAGACLLLAPSVMAAPTPEDKARADALFEHGRQLMNAHRWSEACPLLEESYRTDPVLGSLLNVALCHAGQGRTATAYQEFAIAIAQAREQKNAARVAFARAQLDDLRPRLAHLTLVVEPQAAAVDLQLDGQVVAREAWGTPQAVDPGIHTVTAAAPSHAPFSQQITVAERDDKELTVPALVDLSAPSGSPPAPGAPAAASVAPAPSPPVPPAPPSTPAPSSTWVSSRRVWSYAAGGLGVVAVGLGTYFGLTAIQTSHDSDSHCPQGHCDATAVSQSQDALRWAAYSDVAFGLGAAALAAGAYLFFSAPSPDAPATAHFVPVVGPGACGASWSRSW